MVDFSKLHPTASFETATAPREIFSLLPSKASGYQYLRDVQSEVLSAWYERRAQRDLAIKMNTGSGKTVVGLLILRSCLSERAGPAVYVAASPFLAGQVLREARNLGIEATDEPSSLRFASGAAILVIGIHRLVNGQSTFGVGDQGVVKPIGSIVIDDAHACLETAREQFTLRAVRGSAIYDGVLNLFRDDLAVQSESGLLDIENRDRNKHMLVPFWAWQRRQREVQALIRQVERDDTVKFSFPLIKEQLHLCRCILSGESLEIAATCSPIEAIPSFAGATRRIFMTATFRDAGILVTHFDAEPTSLTQVITPATGGDIGDRLILVPQEANPALSDEDVKQMAVELARQVNVVVIVPSDYRARFWASVSHQVLSATNLEDGIARLAAGHVGLTVMVNRYDGIDLPDDACRVLVIDGTPNATRHLDRIRQVALAGSNLSQVDAIQRIEQGMGRGIRSNNDYCAVILMGRTLTGHLFAHGAVEMFSPATAAQLALSRQVDTQVRNAPVHAFIQATEQFLARDPQWIRASRGAVVGASYSADARLAAETVDERAAFNAASGRAYADATARAQAAVNAVQDERLKDWLKLALAEYQNFVDQTVAQQILMSARHVASRITRPLEGIQYRPDRSTFNQAERCLAFLRQAYPNPNQFIIAMNALLDVIDFVPETASAFEGAMAEMSDVLGFSGSRPENDFGHGPDVLWNLGDGRYLVIECKNGATNETINKHDCNQLNGSVLWFQRQYGELTGHTPVLCHPGRQPERAATLHQQARVIEKEKLHLLKTRFRDFCTAMSGRPQYGTVSEVAQQLNHFGFTSAGFVPTFTSAALPSRP